LEDANVTPKQEPLDIPLKKSKMDEMPLRYLPDIYNQAFLFQFSQLSRQQPWLTAAAASPKHIIPPFSSHLYMPASQEPPVLQNPERVVRHTESERFERTYQPNVALAPRTTVLTKERERERDFDKDRDVNERPNSVIKCELQIKQERPSTPISESPEMRHNSPETSGVPETNGVAAAPISPEGQSGSNEITSSTSPVPANIPNKQESMSPPPSSQSSLPRSHLHNHTIHKTSPVVVKVTTNQPQVNGNKKVPILGNPEFELSTDTDEESIGEPDSSNVNGSHVQTAYDIAKLLLKNNSLEDHEKILNLIKYMENEIKQLKDLHKKEVRELKHQQQQSEDDFRKKIDNLQGHFNPQNNRPTVNSSSVIATSCLSSSSSSSSSSSLSSSSYDYDRLERRNSIVEKPNVIIKPLKKSFRITPCLDDIKPTANIISTLASSTPSIVIMPKREDIINNNNNTKIYNNNNATIVNGQTESLEKTIKAEKL
jgi:hypothetical protein